MAKVEATSEWFDYDQRVPDYPTKPSCVRYCPLIQSDKSCLKRNTLPLRSTKLQANYQQTLL